MENPLNRKYPYGFLKDHTFEKASKWGEKRRKTVGSAVRSEVLACAIRTAFLPLLYRPYKFRPLCSFPVVIPRFFKVGKLVVIVALPCLSRSRIGLKSVPAIDQFLLDQFLDTLSNRRLADPEFTGNGTFTRPAFLVCPRAMHEVEIDEKGIAGQTEAQDLVFNQGISFVHHRQSP